MTRRMLIVIVFATIGCGGASPTTTPTSATMPVAPVAPPPVAVANTCDPPPCTAPVAVASACETRRA